MILKNTKRIKFFRFSQDYYKIYPEFKKVDIVNKTRKVFYVYTYNKDFICCLINPANPMYRVYSRLDDWGNYIWKRFK